MIKTIAAVFFMFLPLGLKRIFYRKIFGYQIDITSKIGFSLVMPKNLRMQKNSKIGHLNLIKGLSEVSLGECASIGNLNWISGFPENTKSAHFADQPNRFPKLVLGDHSAITNRHLIDCTDAVTIGRYSTFAGFRSQILTHSISIAESRQLSGSVSIGDYTFVGTSSVILPNTSLPNFCVLGACSVLNKKYTEEYQLYAGNPAKPIKHIDKTAHYFNRKIGFVV
jgi:acetyltransferase-like isoleucine patch superfamily enzyme